MFQKRSSLVSSNACCALQGEAAANVNADAVRGHSKHTVQISSMGIVPWDVAVAFETAGFTNPNLKG